MVDLAAGGRRDFAVRQRQKRDRDWGQLGFTSRHSMDCHYTLTVSRGYLLLALCMSDA